MLRFLPALGLFLAGCAAPAAVVPGAGHPASATAPAAPLVLSVAPLAPVTAPDLPAALRPSAPMDHAAMGHAPMAMPAVSTPTPGSDDAPIRPVLDAYLVVHDALVTDRIAPEAARRLADAVTAWTATPPPGDPHFWHMRADDVAAVLDASAALAATADVASARTAFGLLSDPFARLVEAAGVPDGYDLARFTCGMADAPAGGIWLQPAGDVANPYFGASMETCGRADTPAPSGHGGMDHSSMDHSTMDHGAGL